MTKILFLDLDGTIREPKSGAKFINDPMDQQLIDGVTEAIAHYHRTGWRIIGITNQGGVAAGHKSLESAIIEQRVTLDLLPELKCIYFCPDYEGNICHQIFKDAQRYWDDEADTFRGTYRKPGEGMLMRAMSEYAPETQNSQHWMIGDRSEDEAAATAAGVNFIWADVWRHRFMKGIGELDLSERDISLETLRKFLAT